MFKTIVWADDGSEPAEKALPLVKELAKEGGATVTIVHVVERVEGIGGVGVPHRADERGVDLHCHLLPGIDDRADHAVRIGRTPQSCCGTSLTAPVGQRR